MEKLLYLVHRIPYPPNKGDKIRSFNLLHWLSQHFDVYLGCFIDEEEDLQYQDVLADYCQDYKCVRLNPQLAKIKSAKGLLLNQALTVPYYANSEMKQWVDQLLARHTGDDAFKHAVVFSSSMAQYISGDQYQTLNRVIDFVDVDSDKWRQYVEKTRFPMSWVYAREHKLLGRYEVKITEEFNAAAFVSSDEAQLFKSLIPDHLAPKVFAVDNGVDSAFFSPDENMEALELTTPCVAFTGAMDYWANIDAVVWFAEKVWPLVLQQMPEATFYIVGGNPSAEVQALAQQQGIVVTGRVKDVRPYIQASHAVVAPLRIARGVQNKVLEGLAMAKVVIATPMAMEGIEKNTDIDVVIEESEADYAKAVIEVLSSSSPKVSTINRAFVVDRYGWGAKLSALSPLLDLQDVSNAVDKT